MKRYARNSVRLLVLCLLFGCYSHAAPQKVDIAKSGSTALRAEIAGEMVQITFDTARIKRADPGFPLALENYSEVSVIQKVSIVVGKNTLWVPRSVFADSFDAREASIQLQKGAFVLTIVGADGADTYWIDVHFDAARIIKRSVYDSFDRRDKPSEETVYAPPKVID